MATTAAAQARRKPADATATNPQAAAARAQREAAARARRVAELVEAMAPHQGRDKGIASQDLADALGMNRRRMRKVISDARCEGVLICGHPKVGYWMPATAEELRMATAFLETRALHSLMLLSRMRGLGMPELLGQLRLNQA